MTMASDLAREALEPFAKAADYFNLHAPLRPNEDDAEIVSWTDHRVGERVITVGDLRRARTAYDAIGSGVKALEWEQPSWGSHLRAHTEIGTYRLKAGATTFFFRFEDAAQSPFFSTAEEAKAAAQADFERRVLSCLSTVAVEEGDAKAEEPVGFAFEVLWHNDTWCLDFSEMPPVAPAGGEIRNVRPLYAATPSTPSPQIGKAGAGPVGEATFWYADFMVNGEYTRRFTHLRTVADQWRGAGHIVTALYTRPVEEPGEVERLTRELAETECELEDEGVRLALAKGRAETAEAALAATRERLEKVLRPLREDLANACSSETIVRRYHVQCVDAALAAITGDAQEAGR